MALKLVKTDMPFSVMSMEADKDYILARLVHFTGNGFHDRAGYLSHMACEKYLKALTIQNDKQYAETHALLDLARLCEPYDSYFAEVETKRVLEQFDMFDQVGRYGGAAKFDPLSKGKSVGGHALVKGPGVQIAGAMIWTAKHLHDLDGFVFKARSLLDHAKVNWHDGLNDILGDGKRLMAATWTFPVPIKQILTVNNRHFKV
jgi:HEPN domain-containing protein